MKESHKDTEPKLLSVVIPILSTLAILGISAGIYYFAKGYRIDISERGITKTGVITIKSEPSSAEVFVNGEDSGSTPKSRTLEIGAHSITIRKDGYREWKKQVEILDEKSTLIFPWLVLTEPLKSNLWNNNGLLEKSWENSDNDRFLMLIKNSNTEYSLWSYRINTYLWDLNQNPVEILKLKTNVFDIYYSNEGSDILLSLDEEGVKKSYLLDTYKFNELTTEYLVDTTGLENYTISWANDDKHILFESDEELISYNTDRKSKTLLLKKNSQIPYVWTTDTEGFFYIIEPIEGTDANLYMYRLRQSKLDGTGSKESIPTIYMQKGTEYIEYYRSGTYSFIPFTNSPESTQTSGQITKIIINQMANGMYIKTDMATYWYSIDTQKYIMVSPYPAENISFSPDNKKLLLLQDNTILVFTYDKDEADHTEIIGTKALSDSADMIDIKWISNSAYITYIQNGRLFISDKDGENRYEIMNAEKIYNAILRDSREYITTLESDITSKPEINQYRIH